MRSLRRTRSALLVAAVALTGLLAVPGEAADAPAGAAYSETYIATPDGESLHAEVMRPKGVKGKTPVILVVSPYLHREPTDKTSAKGPTPRFFDFIEGARVFARGSSVVQVTAGARRMSSRPAAAVTARNVPDRDFAEFPTRVRLGKLCGHRQAVCPRVSRSSL